MIYLIAGAGRCGKSILRQLLCRKYEVSGISTDMLVQMMHQSLPEYGLNFTNCNFEKLHNLVLGLLTYHSDSHNLVIEGYLSPKMIKTYQDYSNGFVRMCVLGCAEANLQQKMQDMRKNPSYNEWTADLSDEDLQKLVLDLIEESKKLKQECLEFGVRYFETSVNFEQTIEKAGEYLVNNF